MASIEKILAAARSNPAGLRFSELEKVCRHFFGEPRQRGTSHLVFKMPWAGDPRVNIQQSKGGTAKDYQVRQVLIAIDRLGKEETK